LLRLRTDKGVTVILIDTPSQSVRSSFQLAEPEPINSDRNLSAVRDALQKKMASDVFTRVVYTENHDQVGHPPGQNRLPTLIDINDHESVFAKKRSTLAAAIMLTSPGIPMIFQGQEMLETRDFGFRTLTPVDFNRAADPKFRGIVQMYRDLIALRRNLAGKTGGLTGQNLNVFHLDDGNKTLAYHRWERGVRATMSS
jgi:1,4-alpha-glucan branching enzyme